MISYHQIELVKDGLICTTEFRLNISYNKLCVTIIISEYINLKIKFKLTYQTL